MVQVQETLRCGSTRPLRRPPLPQSPLFTSHWPLSIRLLCLIVALLMPGCGGCRSKKPPAEEAKKKEEPKPDFEIGQFGVQPFSDPVTESCYKPGHWSQCSIEARANNFDAVGEMELAAVPMDAAQSAAPGGAQA